jgi:hypothetical protein
LLIGAVSIVQGGTLDTILANLKGIDTIEDDGNYHTGYLYNAKVTYRVINGNNNHQLEPDERIYFKVVSSNGDVIETPTDGVPRSQIVDWVKAHSSAIAKIVVGGGGGISSVSQGAGYSNNTAVMMGEIGLDSAVPNWKSGAFAQKVWKRLKVLEGEGNQTFDQSQWDFKFRGEYGSFNTWGDKGHTQLIGVTGERELNFQWKIGGVLSFRYAKVDDQWGTNSRTLTFIPYLHYRFSPYSNGTINIMPYVGGSAIFSDASNFPEVDYFEYGWGVNIVPTYLFNPQFQGELLISYYWDKKYVPSSSLPDNYKFLSTAINNLKPDQILTLGVGFHYLPAPHWKVSGNVLRLQHLLTKEVESGRDKAIYYRLKADYSRKNWSVGAGLRVVTQLEEYRETDLVANFQYRW